MSTLTINNSITKSYSLLDKDHKYYVHSWYNNGEHHKQINLVSIHAGQEEMARPYAQNIDQAIGVKKLIDEIAPIDMRVFMDNIEITEDAKKSEIFQSLNIFEYRIESSSVLRSLTPQAVKAAKEEEKMRAQLTNMIASLNRTAAGLPVAKIKRLNAALKEIQGS